MNFRTLMLALAIVESGNDPNAVGDNGKALGLLQIHKGVVEDVNKHSSLHYEHEDMMRKIPSEVACIVYLTHYGEAYRNREEEEPTYEVYARIWNGGYAGLFSNKGKTDVYWEKVRKELLKLGVKEEEL